MIGTDDGGGGCPNSEEEEAARFGSGRGWELESGRILGAGGARVVEGGFQGRRCGGAGGAGGLDGGEAHLQFSPLLGFVVGSFSIPPPSFFFKREREREYQ